MTERDDYQSVLRLNNCYIASEKEPPQAITMTKTFLTQQEPLKDQIRKTLKRGRKRENKKSKPQVTKLVDRLDPCFSESYHSQMENLALMGSESE